jgi:hypothetical protein
MHDPPMKLLRVLESDGLVQLDESRASTSAHFRGAMARAALRLFRAGDASEDLRVPITMALLETYGSQLSNEELAARVEAMLALEVAELAPALGRAR